MNFQNHYQLRPVPVRYVVVRSQRGFSPLTVLLVAAAAILYIYRDSPLIADRAAKLQEWFTSRELDAPSLEAIAKAEESSEATNVDVYKTAAESGALKVSYAPKTYSNRKRYFGYTNGMETLPTSVGSTATVRALTFDKSQIVTCNEKCRIEFKDHLGRTVTGVFFKKAYGERLLASSGKVTISGIVQRSDGESYLLYLNRVL